MNAPARFPFSAVVGQEDARLALLLVAIDPGIGGVLLRGVKGSAKSTLARGLAGLLPGGAPFVELPLGATEDRVLGTLDGGSPLSGGPQFRPGLLAAAHGGVLYVDDVNLLPDHLVNLLLDVAASGVVRVERDGVSHSHVTRFVLVGSMNPEEGELRPQLLDRFGLAVDITAPDDPVTRAEVVRRRLAHDAGAQVDGTESDIVVRARLATSLPADLPDTVVDFACRLAVSVGADGMRADLVLCRAAAAFAGWEARSVATAADVERVAPVALAHRRRRRPFDPPTLSDTELARALEAARRSFAEAHPPAPDGGGAAGIGDTVESYDADHADDAEGTAALIADTDLEETAGADVVGAGADPWSASPVPADADDGVLDIAGLGDVDAVEAVEDPTDDVWAAAGGDPQGIPEGADAGEAGGEVPDDDAGPRGVDASDRPDPLDAGDLDTTSDLEADTSTVDADADAGNRDADQADADADVDTDAHDDADDHANDHDEHDDAHDADHDEHATSEAGDIPPPPPPPPTGSWPPPVADSRVDDAGGPPAAPDANAQPAPVPPATSVPPSSAAPPAPGDAGRPDETQHGGTALLAPGRDLVPGNAPVGGVGLATPQAPSHEQPTGRPARPSAGGPVAGEGREPVRTRSVGRTVVVAVDASGTAGTHRRVEAASGAVLRLLDDAYLRRDRIAFVTFRGDRAVVVLPPTASTELARTRLAELPTGGVTPLAEGIGTSLSLARRAAEDGWPPIVALVTDGQATGTGDAVARANAAAADVAAAGIDVVVIDAEEGPRRRGLAEKLASSMGARYRRPNEITAAQVESAIRDALR